MLENKELCEKCRGECCKTLPGACYPEDFGLPSDFTKLDTALSSRRYAIDWWEGDPREGKDELPCGYFIRPATKDKIGILHDPSWGGECTFLTKTGCELLADNRPLNCKKLEPKKTKPCLIHNDSGKRQAAIAWIPYHKKLEEK